MPRLRLFTMLLATVVAGGLLAGPAAASWLRPLQGGGNFYSTCDLVTLPREDGSRDVVALVAIAHRELSFENEAGRWRARVRATATITADDGRVFQVEDTVRLVARNEAEAGSPTLSQIFTVVLRDVDAVSGRFELNLDDLNRRRPGFANLGSDRKAYSLVVADWYAPPARQRHGLSVGDAVFLAHAPIRDWARSGRPVVPGADGPWEYINPPRRFGLEAEQLQLYFTLEPPALVEDRRRAAGRDLRVEIVSTDLDFSLLDTLRLTDPARAALAAGRPAAVYYEMDGIGLPPGSFRLGIAPLDSAGRGLLTGFDVVWDLALLARHTDDLLGEGRTVFTGRQLEAFEVAPRVDQEAMLDEYWAANDPSPGDPYNENYAEFRRRAAYVNAFYGGFDDFGARDPRGRIYLLLGEPNSIRAETMPMNEDDLNDARIMVYERYAPERLGEWAKDPGVASAENFGVYTRSYQGAGAIAMPYSYLADKNIKAKITAPDTRRFELWRYDDGGEQLFLNSYTGQGHGLRFLFLDKTGRGDYVLDLDNTRLMGD